MSRKQKDGRGDLAKAFSALMQIGTQLFVCVMLGVLLGKWLDDRFGTSPWLLLVCSFLGMAAAFKSMYDMAKK